MDKKEGFKYSYTAPTVAERREIDGIRKQYLPPEEKGGVERMRELDSKVKNLPMIISLTLGIIGILIFGTGFALVLEWKLMLWGIIVSILGLVPIVLAYPVYSLLLNKNKQKYGKEILQLAEKLLNEKNDN